MYNVFMGKILLLSANPSIINPKSGGSERSFHLLDALSDHEVTILAFGWNASDKIQHLSKNLTFISVSPSELSKKYSSRFKNKLKSKSWDLAISEYAQYDSKYKDKLFKLSEEADLIIIDHYAIAPLVKDVKGKVFYASHNCEIDLVEQLHGKKSLDYQITKEMESIVLNKCIAYSACSKEDIIKINKNYRINKPGYVIANGTIIPDKIKPGSNFKSKDIVFIGSGHPPNVTAALNVVPVANLMPDYNFILIGDASNAVTNYPSNVKVLGHVSDLELDGILKDAFAFINPMEVGSGTHLKVSKALSYALPIISSKVGARGFSNEELEQCFFIGENAKELSNQIIKLTDKEVYSAASKAAYSIAKQYDWDKIKKEFSAIINGVMGIAPVVKEKKITIKNNKVEKKNILIYTLVRNSEKNIDAYYKQVNQIPTMFPQYNFYISIYENDSEDKTREKLFSKNWNKFAGVSIISEKLDTPFFGSVKEEERVKNLALARNKAIEASDFINKVDYVLMIEGDIKYNPEIIAKLLNFDQIEPEFDIVSTISLREHNKRLYDVWATRKSPIYKPGVNPLDEDYITKPYDKYYSTSNGICLYRAEPFKNGIRHHWINSATKKFDCEMVVLCQKFHENNYTNVYILHDAVIYHK